MKRYLTLHKKQCLFLAVCVLSFLILLLSRLFPSFAEGWSTTAGAFVRLALGAVTAFLPFSLFEILVFLFSLYVLFLFGFGLFALLRRIIKKKKTPLFSRLFTVALATLLLVANLFCLGFGPTYFRPPVADLLELDLTTNEEKVFAAFTALSGIINKAAPSLEKNESGESILPAPLSQIKKEVNAAADAFGQRNSFYQKRGFAAKSFLSSPILTYTHISGVYGFFTGEANVNTNYPHFIITATLAHEMCHARGIAPENECNALASLLLMEASSPYLRYCGALFLFDDFYAACKKINGDRANEIWRGTDPVMAKDFAAYSRFFEPYRGSAASKVANKTNSAYLQSMGQSAGVVSYSMVIELGCALMEKQNLL